jgi:hypothetical protein
LRLQRCRVCLERGGSRRNRARLWHPHLTHKMLCS